MKFDDKWTILTTAVAAISLIFGMPPILAGGMAVIYIGVGKILDDE